MFPSNFCQKEASDCGGLYNTPIIALKLPVFISDQMISISSLLNSGLHNPGPNNPSNQPQLWSPENSYI
jgi:hypothetical protein